MNVLFVLTEDHLKLLAKSYWQWQDCETGAPEMDPKRPYGNSDVAGDIREILGDSSECESNAIKCPECSKAMLDTEECPYCGYMDEDKCEGSNDLMLKIHREMTQVIEIVICMTCAGMVASACTYKNVADRYQQPRWEKVE